MANPAHGGFVAIDFGTSNSTVTLYDPGVVEEVVQDTPDGTLAKHLVSVTEVRMSPDLRHATVFVKPLLGQDEEAVLKALRLGLIH